MKNIFIGFEPFSKRLRNVNPYTMNKSRYTSYKKLQSKLFYFLPNKKQTLCQQATLDQICGDLSRGLTEKYETDANLSQVSVYQFWNLTDLDFLVFFSQKYKIKSKDNFISISQALTRSQDWQAWETTVSLVSNFNAPSDLTYACKDF